MIRAQITRIIQADRDDVPEEFAGLLKASGQQHTPLLQILGRTKEGEAQNWFVAGFEPYFYVAAPADLTAADLPEFQSFLENICTGVVGPNPFKRIELVRTLTSMDTYHAAPRALLKITTFTPGVIGKLRDVWLKKYPTGLRFQGRLYEPLVFEADVKFYNRLGLDIDAVPYCWIDVPADKYLEAQDPAILTHCDRTICVHYSNLVVHKPEGEFIGNAPLKMCTFDIECLGRKGVFPESHTDPIGEIAVELHDNINGAAEPIESYCFTTAKFAPSDPDAAKEKQISLDNQFNLNDLEVLYIEPGPPSMDVDASAAKPNPKTPRIVVRCVSEADMLMRFARYIVGHRPEQLGSYNGDKFDWPYLIGRATELKILERFSRLNRTPTKQIVLKENNFQSRAYGRSEGFNVTSCDWESNDELRNLQKDFVKRRSYTLEAVAADELDDHKKPMPHQEITGHHNGTLRQQYKLFDYNFHDVRLTTGIFYKKKTMCNQIEMSRVTGVDVDTLITGGQQVKIHRLILSAARARGFAVPTFARDDYVDPNALDGDDDNAKPEIWVGMRKSDAVTPNNGSGLRTHHVFMSRSGKKKEDAEPTVGYQGATVVEPKRGFYAEPITVLDFSSLYPSIMIQHNLCYSTLIPKLVGAQSCNCREPTPTKPADKYVCAHGHCMRCSQAAVDECRCVNLTPFGARFVSSKVRVGILPQILSTLLGERGKAKRELADAKKAGNMELAAVLDGRQNALKVTANSIYGFTGVKKGKMPCVEISASVTAYGRQMIDFVINLLETKFKGAGVVQNIDILKTVIFCADVIYGDTDSVMVKYGTKTVAEAIAIGKYSADYICASFAAMWLSKEEQRAAIDQFIGPEFQGSIHDALFLYTDTFCKQLLSIAKSTIAIVFEKVLYPYILINKKRYAGGYWLCAEKMDHVHQSGIESVRRDNCEFASDLVGKVIAHLVTPGGTADGSLQIAYQEIKRLLRGEVDIDDLTITRGYSQRPEDYKNDKTQPHLIVNRKRAEREPGSEYQMGDRIRYVLARTPEVEAQRLKSGVKGWMCAEDPDYVKQTGMALYYERYLEKQIKKPLTRIFDAIYGAGFSATKLFDPRDMIVTAKPVNAPILKAFGAGVAKPKPKPAAAKPHKQFDTRAAVAAFNKKPVQTTLQFGVGFGSPQPKKRERDEDEPGAKRIAK